MIELNFLLFMACMLIAFIYTSAGFGGGSGYLALFSLWGISYIQAPQLALQFNIIATLIACTIAWQAGHLKLKPYGWLMAGSIPAILIGSLVPINSTAFYILLSISLAFASLRFFFWPEDKDQAVTENQIGQAKSNSRQNAIDFSAGIGMGLLAGMTGIGGGIFLAPLLLWMHRGSTHERHGATAFFILVNSSLGLITRYATDLLNIVGSKSSLVSSKLTLQPEIALLALAVGLGALPGAWLAHHRLSARKAGWSTGAVLLIATALMIGSQI